MKRSNMINLCHKRVSLLLVVLGLTTIPFLNKPFHIDDPFVLRIAENIIQNPLDPFAGTFDWFGKLDPIFKATTNPHLMSYFLAPFAFWFGQSEMALHAACMFFYFLFAYAVYILGNRFCRNPFLVSLFVMTSAAVVVSGNVMRDVPAAALATAGIAFFIYGMDENKKWIASTGALLCGLSLVTKYSCAVAIPVLLLYPLLKRKPAFCICVLPSLLILGLWCVHNKIMYDSVHILYLFMERSSEQGITHADKWWGALVILSSSLYLFPLLVWGYFLNKNWFLLLSISLFSIFSCLYVQSVLDGEADFQFLFWMTGGIILLLSIIVFSFSALWKFIRIPFDEDAADVMFLFAWFMAPFLFSILFVPFQAVRHLILALPPLALLSFRIMEPVSTKWWKPVAYSLLAMQFFITINVQRADYELANVYRNFAGETLQNWNASDKDHWFIGHWGFQYYMNRAGVMQVRQGELPKPGDYVFIAATPVPESFPGKLALVDTIKFESKIPITVMNMRGASFYALINNPYAQNLPYRFYQDTPLEIIQIFAVKSVNEQ